MSLVVENLTKRFGEKTAVDHISFSMETPGVFGLLGDQWGRQDNHDPDNTGYHGG